MTILIVDERDQATDRLDDGIRVRGYQVARARSCEEAELWCRERGVDLCVVCESASPDATLARVSSLLACNATMRVLLLSANAPGELAYNPRVRIVDDETDLDGALQEVSSCMIAKYLSASQPVGRDEGGDPVAHYAATVGARVAAIGEALRDAQAGAAPLDLVRYLAHRIYGSAAAYGFANLGQIAGELEERILDTFERGKVQESDWGAFRAVVRRLNEAAGLPVRTSSAEQVVSLPSEPAVIRREDGLPHVVLVDDDADFVAEVTALLIELHATVSVVSTTRGLSAQLDKLKPDLVLMNALMPGVSGFDTCRALKGSLYHQQIPVLLATQRLGVGTDERAFRAGADDVVHKPAQEPELRARVGVRLELIRLRRGSAARGELSGRQAQPQGTTSRGVLSSMGSGEP